MTCGVYSIEGPGHIFYIGASRDIERRFKQHIAALDKGKHPAKKLQLDWEKYGKSNFIFRIEEECLAPELDNLEQTYFDLNLDSELYNDKKFTDRNKQTTLQLKDAGIDYLTRDTKQKVVEKIDSGEIAEVAICDTIGHYFCVISDECICIRCRLPFYAYEADDGILDNIIIHEYTQLEKQYYKQRKGRKT